MRRLIAPLAVAVATLFAPPTHAVDKAECKHAAESGQSLRDERRLGAARERFLSCAQQDCPEAIRTDCVQWLGEVDARRPSLVFTAKGPRGEDLTDVRVMHGELEIARRLDGAAVFVDPGEYLLRFESPGLAPLERKIVVAERQQGRAIEVVFAPNAGDAGRGVPPGSEVETGEETAPALPWVFLGVGAAGVTVFGVLQGVARSEYSDLEDGCGVTRSCSEDEIAPVRAKFVASGVALGLGSAALATAVVYWIVDAASAEPPRTTWLLPSVSPTAVELHLVVPWAL